MPLEEALAANTAAIIAHTKALNAFMAAGGKGGAAPAGDKPAGDKPKKTETKSEAPTLETIQEQFGAYMSVTDKDERNARKANIGLINKHFGVERASLLDPSDYEEALGYLAIFAKGKKPKFKEREAAVDDEDDDGEEAAI